MTTANGKYDYKTIQYGKKIKSHVEDVHEKMCHHYGWNLNKLKPFCFGFENLINSIGHVFENSDDSSSLIEVANLVHVGWCQNYLYWRDFKPYEGQDSIYIKPFNPIGDERRDKCAITEFKDLPEEEKEKDIFIAKVLMEIMK